MANYEKKLIKKPNFDYRNIIIDHESPTILTKSGGPP